MPDSLLVNGVGHFDCMMAVPARPVDCVVQPSNVSFVNFDPQLNVRLRVVNTGFVIISRKSTNNRLTYA